MAGSGYHPRAGQVGFPQHKEFCTVPLGLPRDACGCFSSQTCTFGRAQWLWKPDCEILTVGMKSQLWKLGPPTKLKAGYPRNSRDNELLWKVRTTFSANDQYEGSEQLSPTASMLGQFTFSLFTSPQRKSKY